MPWRSDEDGTEGSAGAGPVWAFAAGAMASEPATRMPNAVRIVRMNFMIENLLSPFPTYPPECTHARLFQHGDPPQLRQFPHLAAVECDPQRCSDGAVQQPCPGQAFAVQVPATGAEQPGGPVEQQ